MTGNLKNYFPMIQTRKEVLDQIYTKEKLANTFQQWAEDQQKEFLDFCTGVRGIKLMYDSFFKEIMNPETTPERINEFLSLLLNQKVSVLRVLPNDSTRIADETTLLIMDIVIMLEDGSIANLEVQKIGYSFPGERCACYSSDLLLRQYKRVRSEKKKKFTYKDIKKVYTIVLFDSSPEEFHKYPNDFLHYFHQQSNTGLEMNLLQEYLLIPLDIFRKILQNNGIRNKLDAWLAFLSVDDPETIISIIEKYPKFRPLYEHIYDMCRNVEGVMELFSKELLKLDRNTVQYMIDEMQEEITRQAEQLSQKNEQISKKDKQISQQSEQISRQKKELDEKQKKLDETMRLYQDVLKHLNR